MYSITLTYADGTTSTIPGFETEQAAQDYIEKMRSNVPMDPNIQVQVTQG